MRYTDKNYSKWQRRQQLNEDPWQQSNRSLRRTLDKFALSCISDKDWWRILSWSERQKVYESYHNTLEDFKKKISRKNTEDEADLWDCFWYNYDPEIADVKGNSWEECVPQWLKYVTEKYPQDANVRRELAIRRIFS